MANYLTVHDRTVSLPVTLSATVRISNSVSGGTQCYAEAWVGTRFVAGPLPVPLLLAKIDTDGSCTIETQLCGGFSDAVFVVPPGGVYDVTQTVTIDATLTLLLEQIQDGAVESERVKPGAHHTLDYTLTTIGDSASGTVTLTEPGTGYILTALDYCGWTRCVGVFTETSGSISSLVDLTEFGANHTAQDETDTQTDASGGSCACRGITTALGTAESRLTFTVSSIQAASGSAEVVISPRKDYQVTITPRFFDMLYGGTYKVVTTYGNASIGPRGGGATEPSALDGPYTGEATISKTPGGLSRMFLTDANNVYSLGTRMIEVSAWTIVSASTTSAGSPIAHASHPDGDVYGVRVDKSAGISIAHGGARTIEDGSTLTPTGGEWVAVSGGGSVALASGIELTAGGSASVFRRGWATYDPGTGGLLTGAALDTRAHRFVTLTLTASASFDLWVHLPGVTTAIYGQGEGNDPGSGQGPSGGKRWLLEITPGTHSYKIDLCNPDYWPPVDHVDPPYIPDTGSGGPPEGYEFGDYPAYRNSPSWQEYRGNFTGQASWSRMVFVLPASRVLTVGSIVLDAPIECCLDSGENTLGYFVDGMFVAQFGTTVSQDFPDVITQVDAIEGLTCTTSLTNTSGTAPAAYSSRDDWEEWIGQSPYRTYWGRATVNINIRHATTCTLDWPKPSAYMGWHPGGMSEAVGTNYGPEIYLTLRARFGGSFVGMAFREDHEMGDGAVSVAGDTNYSVDTLGRWGYGDNPPRLAVGNLHVISWDGWDQLEIYPGAGVRGVRRVTSFKSTPPIELGKYPSVATSPTGRTVTGFVGTGDVLVLRWLNPDGTHESVYSGYSMAGRLALAIDGNRATNPLLCLYEDGGDILLMESSDEGRTWGSTVTIGSGDSPAVWVGATGLLFLAWVDSGALKLRVRHATGDAIATATVVASGVDSLGLGGCEVVGTGLQVLSYTTTGGAVETITSDDGGVTWA